MTHKDPELPEAYAIGWVPFIHTNIWLDSRPLIPRAETEYWANEVIRVIHKSQILNPKSIKILDLCAGSGCIGVAVMKDIPDVQVDFAEIDENHHKTIEKNIRENGVDGRDSRIFGGDLFENITDSYDFILTNPPYIDRKLGRVADSVQKYEPSQALYGGVDGLEIINKILAEAPKHLNRGGWLYIEHEPEQVEAISHHPLFINSVKDQYDRLRFSKFQCK